MPTSSSNQPLAGDALEHAVGEVDRDEGETDTEHRAGNGEPQAPTPQERVSGRATGDEERGDADDERDPDDDVVATVGSGIRSIFASQAAPPASHA